MKKILAILSIVALASCGNGGASTEVKSDSTQVVDSVSKVDSVLKVDSVELGKPQPGIQEAK